MSRKSKISLDANDKLVSFVILSLFTMVPVGETLEQLSEIFLEETTRLLKHCLTTNYFQWDSEFYEQVHEVPMDSPFSLVIAYFYMELFEQRAFQSDEKRPTYCPHYADDTFAI